MPTSDLSRRAMLAVSTLLPLTTGSSAEAQSGQSRREGPKTLVAFFTRSGNTRVIAGTVHRALAADLFEIRPARPYPEDYEETVAQAERERVRSYEPPLAARVPAIDGYDTLFLGFPIWGTTAPAVIRSFLHGHDLKGKTIRPFITHGGYGIGSSLSVVASHEPGARIEPAFVLEADQERRTLNQVKAWLGRS